MVSLLKEVETMTTAKRHLYPSVTLRSLVGDLEIIAEWQYDLLVCHLHLQLQLDNIGKGADIDRRG